MNFYLSFQIALCGLIFGQFLIGDVAEAKEEMEKLFSKRPTAKVGIAEERHDGGRCEF